ncbi:MAG: hypothetical protein RIR00_2093, partial [Pseudomonadota bacterium]
MTVTKKMTLLVLSALLGILTLTATGIYQIQRVYELANYANINTVPSLVHLNLLMRAFNQERIRVYRHILTTDENKMHEVEASLAEARKSVEQEFKNYEALLSDERDRQYLSGNRALFQEYNIVLERPLALS